MKHKLPKKSEALKPVLIEFKDSLAKLYGDKMRRLILFGSYARGQQHDESDVDLLLILSDMDSPSKELNFMNELKTEFSLNKEIYFSVIPTTEKKFNEMQNPLYMNIIKEGITL